MTLSRAISEWVRELRATGKATQTVAAYESDLRRMSKHATLDTVLHFTPELVRAYFEWESTQNRKMTTLHRKQAAVRVFARWCVDNRIIAEDPTRKMPVIKRPETLPRPFNQDEIERLWALELSEPRERLLRALLFFSGLRITPIMNIRIGDISDRPPTIRVVNKGNREQVVPMHPDLAAVVLEHVLSSTDLKAASYLLTQANGRRFTRKVATKITREWGVRARVRDCKPHRYRHTFGTRLLELVKDLRLVQEAMGHRDIKSTTIYTKVTSERLTSAVSQLSFGPGA